MAGTVGYELDLGALTKEEKEEVKKQIADYHKYAPLIQNGKYYRLSDPFHDEICAWEFASEDGKEALLNVVMQEIHGNMTVNYVKMRGLNAGEMYQEKNTGKMYSGAALMDAGIPVPVETGEYQGYQLHFAIFD